MTAIPTNRNRMQPVIALCLHLMAISVLALIADFPATAQTSSIWTGGGGEWAPCPPSGNALWSTCPVYPDGNFNAVIQGGPVTLSGSDGNTIVNLTVSSGDSLEIVGGYLDLTGNSLVNNGTITISSGNGLAIIGQGQTVTLSGNGAVNLTSSNAFFSGTAGSSPTLINQETIMGQGSLGHQGFSIINQGTINASGGLLTVQTDSAGITNTSLIEATSGGTLSLIAPVVNTGGKIEALGRGTVSLNGNITGGTLTTSGTGSIQVAGDSGLIGVTNSGTLQVSSDIGFLQNTMTNSGTIQLLSGNLTMTGGVTLEGSGSLIMSGSSNLEQSGGGGSLTNQQLIHGAGTINQLPLTNQGTIEADNPSSPLYLFSNTTTNTATMEASGGATLQIESGSTVNNAGGTVSALTGSTVLLQGTLNGGTLKTSGSGVIDGEDGTLDGTVNIPTNTGTFNIPTSNNFTFQGTINNTGTISLGANDCIVLNQPTTLTGTGRLTMASNSCIYGSGNSLTNESTIEGTGTIGDSNPMPIINNGTILANSATALTIVPNSVGFTNNGKLTVNSGSTLIINANTGPFTNLSGGTLTGGTYNVTGTLEFPSGITTNAASITLTGAAEILNASTNANALAALAVNNSKGVLLLQNAQALTTSVNFKNSGKTTVAASSGFTVGGSYTQSSGTTTVDGTLTAPKGMTLTKGTLLGKGTIAASVTSNSTVTVGDSTTKPGLLTVSGAYTQHATGVLDVAVGGTTVSSQYSQMAVSNGVSLGGTLTIKLINGFVPAIGATFTILTGSAVTGQFATVNGTSINSSEHFEVGYSGTAVTLTVVSGA